MCKKPESFRFCEYILSVLMVEEVAIIGIIHDHIDSVIFQKSVPQLDDMRMVNESMNGDFPLKQFHLSVRGHIIE